ncbi:MAG TPA: hypothetical protein VHC97_06955 [Thermoanaerobaculia bacterium]|jgi:hypothetical protein|nr:hypothetical protein [Thermoanaerobaculia bacterium]
MKSLHRILLPAALAALLIPVLAQPAAAQSQPSRIPSIGEVEIVVRDIGTKRDVATVHDGETLSLPEGMRVRLIMTARPTGSARGPYYPETEFTDQSQGGVRIIRSNEENSTADLEVVNPRNTRNGNTRNDSRNRDRVETIRYQINESWVPSNLRSGSFRIAVGPADSEAEVVKGWSAEQARELTRVLYRGILMREPDSGAGGTVSAIQRGGYDALVRAAVGIADSDESRIRVYEKQGVCNEQRLLALYKNFLGVSSDQINRRQWDADLRRMRDGEIGQVVETLLQSDRFRSRYNVTLASR